MIDEPFFSTLACLLFETSLPDNNADDLNSSDAEGDDETMDDGDCCFQRTVWTLRKLPYAAELEIQADEHFRLIKEGFANSVLLKDRCGLMHCCDELEKYVLLYSYRFTKDDHIALLRLLVPFIKKGEIYHDIAEILRTLTILLKKRGCLTRRDLTFNWRPIYELYNEVAYGSLEHHGVFSIPGGFQRDICNFIRVAREFWPLAATQEILDEFRPFLCPRNTAVTKVMNLLHLFLPTVMARKEHLEHGAGLWFDEVWHHFLSTHDSPLLRQYQMHLFARIARDIPGLFGWSDKLNVVFSKLMRSLRLGSGSGLNQDFPEEHATIWLVHIMGIEKEAQSYLIRLMTLIESFMHPSNDGIHTSHLFNLVYRLAREMVDRVKRERSGKFSIPEHLKMTEESLNDFVSSLMPCVKLAFFTKEEVYEEQFLHHIIKNLVLLAPKIILPALFENIKPALESVLIPDDHRLVQSLSCLFVAIIPIMREQAAPGERSRKAEVILLLNTLLPAIDTNDHAKAMKSCLVLGILVNTVPLIDCSEAVHHRQDLTEDEEEAAFFICTATANIQSFVLGFIDQIETVLDWGANNSESYDHDSLAKESSTLDTRQHILKDGLKMVFKGIVINSSREVYLLTADRLYQIVANSLCDSHFVANFVSEIISITVRVRPELSFHRFLTLISKKLHDAITPDVYEEDKVNFTITYWLRLTAGLFRVQAPLILQNAEKVKAILRLGLSINCSIGHEFALDILQRVLRSLTTCYQDFDRAAMDTNDLPLDQNLPIRAMAVPLDRRTYDTAARWFVPTEESIRLAKEILDEHLNSSLEKITDPAALSKQQLLREMLAIHTAVQGAAFSLPEFNSPIVSGLPTVIDVPRLVTRPAGTPQLTTPSGTIRGAVLSAMERLQPFLLEQRESEVKTVSTSIYILESLVFSRGGDSQIITNHGRARVMLGDRLSGTQEYIKGLTEESVTVAHQHRVYYTSSNRITEEHKRIIEILFKLSISNYTEIRSSAQSLLSRMLCEFPYSYTLVVDDILKILSPEAQSTHSQLKGALHMLIDGNLNALMLRENWATAAKVWPALVRMQHSERPSIISLLEDARSTIVAYFASFQMLAWSPNTSVDELAVDLLGLRMDGNSDAKSALPDEIMKETAAAYVEEQNELNQRSYDLLVTELLQCAGDSSLHWSQIDLAHFFLKVLIRRDVNTNPECVRLFLRLCIHDSLKTRERAIAYMRSWLRINKPISAKHVFQPEMVEDNRGPGAKWPIAYGIRQDNICMQYDDTRLPSTASEWESFPFVNKIYWGFYCWPENLTTYAFVSKQNAINQSYEELSEIEKFVVDTLKDPSFAARFLELYSIEETKGEDNFNSRNFNFFKGLFRSFNDILLQGFIDHLEALVDKDDVGATKLAAEIFAGIVSGSKLWKFEKVQRMWSSLAPFLKRVLSNLKDNAEDHWGSAIRGICHRSDARMLRPLIDVLIELALRPSENCFVAASRLRLLGSALYKFEWRCMQLWNRLAPYAIAQIAQPYANVRDQIAQSLVNLTWYDLSDMKNDESVPAEFKPYTTDAVLDAFDVLLTEVWNEARLGESQEESLASSFSLCSITEKEENDSGKSGRLALKSLTEFISTYFFNTEGALSLRVLNYLPLLAHFSFDKGDDDLLSGCANTLSNYLSLVFIVKESAEQAVELFEKFLADDYSWKVRMVLINQISTLVFANSFVIDEYHERIGRLIASQLTNERLEVHESAAVAISRLIISGFLPVTQEFIKEFISAATSNSSTIRRSGVLGLCSIVKAFPYSVPPFLPEIISFLCVNGRKEKETIKNTIMKTLSEFKRTHRETWDENKAVFSEEQLVLLMDSIATPSYYV